jgi:hypothetical protein
MASFGISTFRVTVTNASLSYNRNVIAPKNRATIDHDRGPAKLVIFLSAGFRLPVPAPVQAAVLAVPAGPARLTSAETSPAKALKLSINMFAKAVACAS